MDSAIPVLFAAVLSVYDGDTITVNIEDCKYPVMCNKIGVRLRGFDTPEIKGKCPKEKELAQQAKKIAEEAYPVGSRIVLANPGRDAHFRILAEAPALQKRLIDAGLAVPYDGGHKSKDWCAP